ncbi:probable cytochrome P450 9f2 isoform X1 [Armigeres subalbatus]|uniref:probable cytochrome P450 9f2 isoform X1 n=1 Tax=Armigeres subalbatus TaxID=124917 RepID=UPI002ED1175B
MMLDFINPYYLLPIVLAIMIIIYRRVSTHYGYFRDKPIPSMTPVPIFGSNLPLLMKKCTFFEHIQGIYNQFPNAKALGFYDMTTRFIMLRDAELIKKVLIKDFDYFVDRRTVFAEDATEKDNVLITKTLLMLTGQKWRDMRATLSPAFTGSKMRAMFELIVTYSDRMVNILRGQASEKGFVDYEMKEFCSRICSDIIATCAYGLEVESLANRENDFYMMGKKMINFGKASFFVKFILYTLFPKLMKKLQVDLFDGEQIKYFTEIIKDTIKTRDAHGIVRPDMIHLLMQARKGVLRHQKESADASAGFATVEESDVGKVEAKEMTEMELVAQCFIFFIAGFEAISTQMTLVFYELAANPDVQKKLYEEIANTHDQLQGTPLTYDTLQQMKYLDMVTSEVLRLWSGPATDRKCVRDYVLDDGEGLKFTIDAGTCVMIPSYGIHRDPKYYPEPDKFDPERFSEERRASIDMTMYLPFGAGPRNCIGSRFALMEMKALVYALLLNFSVERNEKTQVPIQFPKGFAPLFGQNGLHLRLKVRQ